MTASAAAEQLEEVWNVDPDSYTLRDGVAERVNSDPFEEEAISEEPPFGPQVKPCQLSGKALL